MLGKWGATQPGVYGVLDFRELTLQQRRVSAHRPVVIVGGGSADVDAADDTIYTIGFLMESIVAQFILNEKHDQDTTGHAESEAQDVDQCIPFVT